MNNEIKTLSFNSIMTKARSGKRLLCFCANAKDFTKFASVLQAKRDTDFKLTAYQRPEVKGHVQEIAEYLKKEDAVLPNSIVVALNPISYSFTPYERQSQGIGKIGELQISYNAEQPAAWIIDGQQRTLALKLAKPDNFPIFITAICDDDLDFQRQQFVNVNSVKPLPKSLIYELLPHLKHLPKKFSQKAIPATIAEILASQQSSPFFGLIKLSTIPKEEQPNAVIGFNSIVESVSAISRTRGGLIAQKLKKGEQTKLLSVANYLMDYWQILSQLFPNAWAKPPSQSRLTHGVGIWAMTVFAAKLADKYGRIPDKNEIENELSMITSAMAWTIEQKLWENFDGVGNDIKWNELQNTAIDKKLLLAFVERKWNMNSSKKKVFSGGAKK